MDKQTESRVIDLIIRVLFLALFVWSALVMVAPMAGIAVWAVVLCVAVYPAYDALKRLLGGRGAPAAVLLTVTGLVVTLGPVAALAAGSVRFIANVTGVLSAETFVLPDLPDRIVSIPTIGPHLAEAWTMARTNIEALLSQFAPILIDAGTFVLGKIAGVSVGLLAMSASVILMGVLFGPGPGLVAEVRRFANRVFAPRGSGFVDLAGATVRNVSRGVIGVAVIQSLLAGIIMVAFGVPAAGPLSLIALVLAIVQVGPGPILIPVIIWAWTAMSTGGALAFTAVMLPVMIVDNVLRPIFIARGLNTPMLVILIGVLGGMFAYGLIGLFIGPVILAVFYELLTSWMAIGHDAPAAPDPADRSETG